VPEHLGNTTFAPAVASGSVDGVDASAALAAQYGGRFLTGNITFYPKTATLFADASRLARFTSAQQQVLRSAARRTLAFALAVPPSRAAPRRSAPPAAVVTASELTVDAIGRAAQPFTPTWSRTRSEAFIRQISR
jgi:hypothetical protein